MFRNCIFGIIIQYIMRHLFFFIVLFSIHYNLAQDSPPNIILMIGDGMGLTQISSGMYSNGNKTALESFEYVGLSKTHALDKLVTDSAASGTAMACGVKTYNGVIGIDGKNKSHTSILELYIQKGYSSGLVVTSSVVHATPASFYAKVTSRYLYEKIAFQLSEHNLNLFVGGGEKHFVKRKDKRNLISEMNDYEFVNTIEEFKNSKANKIGFLTYDDEPPSLLEGRKPPLNQLVDISLEKMNFKNKPFFLLIEGSQIDWGGHDNKLNYVTSEFIEFNKTIKTVIDFAKNDGNTLVIVTADHETGGLAITKGNLNKSRVFGRFNTKHHSATMVPVFSYGPQSELFTGIYENTAIFEKMHLAFLEKK